MSFHLRYEVLIGIFFIVSVFSGVVAIAANYYAVIIGIADYPGTINDLHYTTNDAIAIRNSLLDDPSHWRADDILLLLNSGASKTAIHKAISSIAEKGTPDDVFLFYFSGHGTAGPDIAPLDEADGRDEYICSYGNSLSEFIRDDELSDWLGAIPMKRIIVMLDTCYSGGQIKSLRGDREVKSFNRGPAPDKGDGFASDLRKINRRMVGPQDLNDLDKQIVVLTSSDDNEYSWELGPPIDHGLFTYYLLEALGGAGDKEGNSDGNVTAKEAYNYLYPRVVSTSDTYDLNQHPQFLDLDPNPLTVRSWDKPDNCSILNTILSPAGWHMISIPGAICGGADVCTVLQDDLDPFYLFAYDPTIGGYVMAPPCDGVDSSPGMGYWVRTYDDEVPIDTDVKLLTQPLTLEIKEGWNQIGDPFLLPVCLREIQVVKGTQTASLTEAGNLGWVSTYLFSYDPTLGGYQMVNPPNGTLEPWQGYWLRAYTDCELIIPPIPCPPAPPTSSLAYSADNVGRMELPPPPPNVASFPLDADASPIADSATGARVDIGPNPASDSVTFIVHGVCWCHVEGLRIKIYDLSGRCVYSRESTEPIQRWRLNSIDGNPLSNGVYLVRAWVSIDGIWHDAGTEKLAICR